MAKKKTKTKASLLVAEAVAAVNTSKELCRPRNGEGIETHASRNEGFNSKQMRTVEIMAAHLKPSVGKSSSLHMKPRVILTAEDALRLKLRVDDDVILASLHEDSSSSDSIDMRKKVKALLVLPVEIFEENLKVHEGSSPALRRTEVSHKLRPGTIQLTSSSVLEMLESTSKQESCIPQNTKTDVASIVRSPTSPSSTSFSFKNMVQTPKASDAQVRASVSSKTGVNGPHDSNWRLVHLTACKSKLGRCILQKLSVLCSRLVVKFIDVNSKPIESNELFPKDGLLLSSSLPSSGRLLERLVHAHVVGSFVQRGQVLRISLVGKPYHVQIVELLPCSNDANSAITTTEMVKGLGYQVEDDFSKLSINDDERCISNGSMSLIDDLLSCDIQLYQIGRSTTVSLFFEDSDGETSPIDSHEPHQSSVIADFPSNHKQLVAGLSSTIQEVRSLMMTPLRQPDFFAKRGLKAPRGVLLHGPSGVGKTCLARQLSYEIKAESNKWNCDVRYLHCASLQSKSSVVGEAESALTRLFHSVNHRSILIILDDVHLICSRRGSGSTGTDRLAATLLALLDGIESTRASGSRTEADANVSCTGVFVLAITTNPSLLDPALRRPGRLDNEVEVPLPEETSTRAEILQFHLNEFIVPVSDNLVGQKDWLEVAKLAKGFNGADCMLAAKEALRFALMESPELDLILKQHHLISAIRSIKPSAIKSITVEIPQVPWSSIGGMDSVKRELREAIELPLTHSEYFQHLRIPPPRGILLYGPPGCSKTLMARALASEGNMNFLAVKGPELLSKWLGESERALSSLFRRARMASPAIIFFDEIDAIGANRGSGDSASSGRLLSQLLTELDGINHTGSAAASNSKKQHRVVVVGATNRPDLLDTALTRPGRIDRMIYVGPPDAASRAQILQLSLQNVQCGNDIEVSTLANDAHSAGFSGAEMVAICRDAALLALEEVCDIKSTLSIAHTKEGSMPVIEMRHLLSAMQQMQRQITPEMIEFYTTYRERHFHKRQG
jgi:transitional endoplasmic reticulum ATPase